MEITIQEYKTYVQRDIQALYKSVGWSAYYADPVQLKKAFENSLCVFAAYNGEKLVGLVRAVGDGASVVFIQDILVQPEYQRRGIGRKLLAQLFSRYHHVRQMHLMTDDLPRTVGFYKAVGFTPVEDLHFRAFTRLHY